MTITNEDNMALMARYPDKYFDLAIVDPPYGIGASMGLVYIQKRNFKKQKKNGMIKHQTNFILRNYLE